MNVTKVKYSPFNLRLKKPFKNSRFTITNRQGFYLELINEEGQTFIGEACPLPGFSSETLKQVEKELEAFSAYFNYCDFSLPFEKIIDWCYDNKISPSTKFCIEQLFINQLFGKSSFPNLFEDLEFNKIVEVNGIVGLDSHKQIISRIESLVSLGFSTIKLKTGTDNFEDELKLFAILNQKFPKLKLRLDANGAWTKLETIQKLNKLSNFNIEYIEQPTSELNDLVELSKQSSIPIAVDESIQNVEDAKYILEKTDIKFIVIKPMMLGFIDSIEIIKMANKIGKFVIISSLFESCVGRAGLILLASLVKNNTAHGLATADYLQEEVFIDFYEIKNGNVKFDVNSYPHVFNRIKSHD